MRLHIFLRNWLKWTVCLFLAAASPAAFSQVYFSEILYHPVEETAFNADGTPVMDLSEEVHEFVELHNPGSAPVPLAGWKLTGGISFEFPPGAIIAPGGFVVIAKDTNRIAALPQYQIPASILFGPYKGQLGNKGEALRLRTQKDELADSVAYSASFPWAIGADALGADEEWTGLKNSDYLYRGRSLERVSYNHPANDPANWLASPAPGNPSPGRKNNVVRSIPLPVVTRIDVYQDADEQRVIRRGQPARVDISFSSTNELGQVSLEYFLDDINSSTEPTTNVVMTTAGDATRTRFTAVVPGLPDRTIVRYRIMAERAGNKSAVSPRADDPFAWHAYFVSPVRSSSKPIYDCFISTASLTRLGANIAGSPRRVTSPDPPGNPRTSWNSTEPAIFVHDGIVRDIRMRHHGSRYNRNPGRNSFKWSFPRYNLFQGTDAVFETDKGNDFVVGHGLFINAGLPVSSVRYVDLYLNGNAVMQRLEQGEFNGDLLDRYHESQQKLNPGSALEPSGEIFKDVGTIDLNGEGPYGRGDGRKLGKPAWPDWKMYEWTYSIQNHSWRGHSGFKEMIDALWKARGDTPESPNAGTKIPALREYFTNYWDIDTTLTYLAVENWACPWDDTTQNHFLWRRANGKWSMLPWDCDAWFGRGDNTPASSSIFIGEVGDRNNNFRGPNFFKDAFLKAFRQEYKERLYVLNNTFLNPTNITGMGFGSIRSFADARFIAVNQQCGFGPFQRPSTPTNLFPIRSAAVVPNARFQVAAYSHSAATPSPHAKSIWEIRRADGNYQNPVFKESSSTNLVSLPIPFKELDFGASYFWRCTFVDQQGHPSIPSDESSFSFGAISSGTKTNDLKLVSIDAATLWKYEQSGTDLGTAWKEPRFDDSSWASGPALLALETAQLPEPIRTPLKLGPLTYYFRHAFSYAGPATTVLSLKTVLDDSAVVYLNGKEIWRNRVSGTPPLYSTLADANVSDAVYEGPFEVAVQNMVSGTNILAVEVHQSAAASSDVVFGLELSTRIINSQAGDLVLNEIFAGGGSGTSPDYVELYNTSSSPILLDGHSLSDSVVHPDKFVFPAGIVIPARGFLTVWCDDNSQSPGIHTGFALDSVGQTVTLFGPSTNGPSVKDTLTFGLQLRDFSVGRVSDGSASWTLNKPTPGGPNLAQNFSAPDLLRINEWMASPLSGDDWFELFNPGPLPSSIGGCFLTSDLANPSQYAIPQLSFISPGGHLLFQADGNPQKGADHAPFKLSASGDFIGLSTSNKVLIDAVTFTAQKSGVSQGRVPDGGSVITSFPTTSTPGESNYLPHPSIVINEVLAASTAPYEDAVEVRNLSGSPVPIGGWFLSDDRGNLAKYKIPQGTIVPANGYIVLYENAFNSDTNSPTSFGLSSVRGDRVVLSAVDTQGLLNGFQAVASFGASPDGLSFGRFETSTGVDFTLMSHPSFGSENAYNAEQFRRGKGAINPYPLISPVVITEIMYHPPDVILNSVPTDDSLLEFIELRNASSQPVSLFDSVHPTNSWQVRGGVELDLPTGLTLNPGQHLILVNFDPATNATALAAFRSKYSSAASARLFGPYRGRLGNGSEKIELLVPRPPVPPGEPNAGFVPYVVADMVNYSDTPPWPARADGNGESLHRIADRLYGNDPANWTSAPPNPDKSDVTQPGLDTDQDGIPDAWEIANGLNRLDPLDAAQDPDGDGFSNLQEFLAGTEPRNANSHFELEISIDGAGSRISISFHAVAGRTYRLESRGDVASGAWATLGTPISAASSGRNSFSDSLNPSVGMRYYRVRLQ